MSNFYTLLTNIGAALHANAQVQQTTVAWSHFALGDGNGAAVVPTQNQTGLRREVHRLAITSIETHPDNPNWIVVEAVVPSDVGGWTVRESAIYGGPGGNTCIAVGNYPETYKPVLAEGAGREMVMRMIVEISSVATVKLQIDPAVAIASRQWVQSLVASPEKAGLVKLANVQEHFDGMEGGKAATPEGVKAVLDSIRGLPIFFQGIHGGTREGLKHAFNGMATPDDGIQLSALTHPEIVKGVLRGDVASCTEAEWLADPYKRGMWSRGTAKLDEQGKPQGWVRLSDRNGVREDSLPAPFWRGGADAKVGGVGKDTMRNIRAEVGVIYGGLGGAFYELERLGNGVGMAGGSNSYGRVGFDASRALPVGHVTDPLSGEFAPWNITGVSYTITANGSVNEAALDAAGVMAQVLLLQGLVLGVGERVSAAENELLSLHECMSIVEEEVNQANVEVLQLQERMAKIELGRGLIDVTSHRMSGVIYTNMSGRELRCVVIVTDNGAGAFIIRVEGFEPLVMPNLANGVQIALPFTVPVGKSYSVDRETNIITRWWES